MERGPGGEVYPVTISLQPAADPLAPRPRIVRTVFISPPQTAAGHDAASNVAGREIAQRWQNRGGLAVYGYPISEVFAERDYDGDPHYVQYFERYRLEYHPVNPAPYDILLGQLGRQTDEARYGGR